MTHGRAILDNDTIYYNTWTDDATGNKECYHRLIPIEASDPLCSMNMVKQDYGMLYIIRYKEITLSQMTSTILASLEIELW